MCIGADALNPNLMDVRAAAEQLDRYKINPFSRTVADGDFVDIGNKIYAFERNLIALFEAEIIQQLVISVDDLVYFLGLDILAQVKSCPSRPMAKHSIAETGRCIFYR